MGGRAVAHWTVDVDRPPNVVYDYLADVSKHGDWSPKPYRTEGAPPGPVTAGTAFTSWGWIPGDKEHENQVTVAEAEAPRRLVFESHERGEVFVNTFEISAAGSGSRVERTMDMPKPGGAVGLIFPVAMATFVKPAVQKGMNMMKANLESAPS